MMTMNPNSQDIKAEVEIESRNIRMSNRRDKDGARVDSMESQKIDSLLRKSVDNFISDSNDIFESLEKLNKLKQKQNEMRKSHKVNNKGYETAPATYSNPIGNLPRSASQKYNYKRANDPDSRFLHISPLGSGEKPHSNFNTRVKSNKMLATHYTKPIPTPVHNYIAPPKYNSLMPQHMTQDNEIYYIQNLKDQGRLTAHYSFSSHKRPENINEGFGQHFSNSLNYNSEHHNSLDRNLMNEGRFINQQDEADNAVYNQKNASPEFQYYAENDEPISSQKYTKQTKEQKITSSGKKIKYPEGRQSENQSYPAMKIPNNFSNYHTINEEVENKDSKYSHSDSKTKQKANHGHNRNATHVTYSNDEAMIENDDTVFETGHANKYRQVNHEESQPRKTRTNQTSINPPFDSFSHQLGNLSKVDSPDKDPNQNMNFLCLSLYEILNRNQIPVRQNADDSSQDMVIKVFETVAHELRLKKERVENLETQDSENIKTIDKLKDANEQLQRDNQKLSQKLENQIQDYTDQLQSQQEHITELQTSNIAERERLKIDIDRLKNKNRNLEIKFSQMEDEINDSRSEIEVYKDQIRELKLKLRQKDETFFKNKLIKDKVNASFDMDSSEQLIDNLEYFNKKKPRKSKDKKHRNHEESEEYSRAIASAEKPHLGKHHIEIGNAEMFDFSNQPTLTKDDEIVNTWFFRVLNELFAPYKNIKDQNELLSIIKEQYGKLLQAEELIQLKTQIEIILNLPKNTAKALILNKIKDLRTSSLMISKDSDSTIKYEEFDHVNKNFEAYEEMKNMFNSIKSSLKLQNNATFTETLKAVKRMLTAKKASGKIEKTKYPKPKPKMNPSNIALRKTKIDLDPASHSFKKKSSPSVEGRS